MSNINSMESLLTKSGLKDKFLAKFQNEGITLERFEKIT